MMQQVMAARMLDVCKTLGRENVADLLTKGVAPNFFRKLMPETGLLEIKQEIALTVAVL
jgi:hypothetical protein